VIEVEQLTKHFRKIQAVNGINFIAHDGEVLGLLGPNGAGKTTTMRLISTLLEPTSGSIRLGGFNLRTQKEQARQILGALPEYWGLYGRFTPREHLRHFGCLYKFNGAKLEQRIDQIIELFEMQAYADRRCEPFSKGMKQRVAIARSLIHDPSHLLLDEPTSGLDVMSARQVRSLIGKLKNEGRCIVISTHILSEAERLCDRIVIIDRGLVIAEGAPAELCQRTNKSNLEEAFISLIGREEVEVLS